jgi:hypothetical protein
VEKPYAKLGFKGVNLPGCRRLAEMQSSARSTKTAEFGGGNKHPQRTKVHGNFNTSIICMKYTLINALDAIKIILTIVQPENINRRTVSRCAD